MTDRVRARLANRPPGYPYSIGRTLAIYAGLMTVIMLAALDQTIVATAVPVVVTDLGGLSSYAWVFTAYLLGATVTVPLYGRLGDIFGRRRMFFVSIPIFIVGSLLCGVAQDMTELIVCRGIQGLGAGGVIPLAMATTGEIVPPRERGRFVALISSTFLTASILGPAVGGLIVDHTSWRWIFFVNLPVGSVALLVIALTMPRKERKVGQRIDYVGAALLSISTTSLLLGILDTGRPWSWIVCAGSFPLFVIHTLRAPAPIVPIAVVRERIVAAGALATGLSVMCQFGTVAFVTLFAQGVLGVSATSSGLVLVPQTVGAVGATILAGQWVSRTGRYRSCALLGPIVMGTGMLLLGTMDTGTTMTELAVFTVVVGIGSGLMMQTFMVAGQSAVPVASIGSATSTIQFSRAIGTSVGVSLFGAIVNHGLPAALRGRGTIVHTLPPASRSALAAALQPAFLLGAGLSVTVFVIVWLGLEERPLRRSIDDSSPLPMTAAAD